MAPKAVAWTFNGVFGRYDYPQLRRGLQVYNEVCAACHGLRLVAYRDLAAIGLSEAQIRAIAGDKEVAGEPDECVERFRAYAEAGLDIAVPYQVMGPDPDRSLRLAAREIFPKLT